MIRFKFDKVCFQICRIAYFKLNKIINKYNEKFKSLKILIAIQGNCNHVFCFHESINDLFIANLHKKIIVIW